MALPPTWPLLYQCLISVPQEDEEPPGSLPEFSALLQTKNQGENHVSNAGRAHTSFVKRDTTNFISLKYVHKLILF